MGPKNQLITERFDISDGTASILPHGVDIRLSFPIRGERRVVTIEEQNRPRRSTGIHAQPLFCIGLDDHEALPTGAAAFRLSFQAFQESLLELGHLLHMHPENCWFGGGDVRICDGDVIEVVGAGTKAGGSFIDLSRVDEVQHGQTLDAENFIHGFETQAPLVVEEIGDMGLLETGLLRQAQASEFARVDALTNNIAEIVLQRTKFHEAECNTL